MAITLGATVTTDVNAAAGDTSNSVSHTVDVGTTLLLVKVCTAPTLAVLNTITYNSVGLTLVPSSQISNTVRSALYYLVNPPAGAHTLALTWAASTRGGFVAENWLGVDTGTPFGTAATGSGSSTGPTVAVTSAAGEVVVDAMAALNGDATTATVGGSQTETVANFIGSPGGAGNSNRIGVSYEPGAGSVTMSWTLSTARAWTISALPLKPAASGSAGADTYRSLGWRVRRPAL